MNSYVNLIYNTHSVERHSFTNNMRIAYAGISRLEYRWIHIYLYKHVYTYATLFCCVLAMHGVTTKEN